MMPRPRHALVRSIPDSFVSALTSRSGPPPAVDLARNEHARYVTALREGLGLDILTLPADEAQPDCVFVEDSAIVVDGLAIETRSAVPSRQGERAAVIAAVGAYLPTATLPPGATLDGGDVLAVGRSLYVGLTARSNPAAVAALQALLPQRRVVGLPVPHGLHLKCHATSPDNQHILLAEGTLPAEAFAEPVWWVPAEEAEAANVVGHAGGVLVAEGAPRTAALLAEAGLRVYPIATTQVARADGALSCCAILFP